jgi:hypothetical protein
LIDVPHPEYIIDIERLREILAELEALDKPDWAVMKAISEYKARIQQLTPSGVAPES